MKRKRDMREDKRAKMSEVRESCEKKERDENVKEKRRREGVKNERQERDQKRKMHSVTVIFF